MKFLLSFFTSLIISSSLLASDTVKVLFIGNSYIATNGLPNIIEAMAASSGDHLIQSSITPGGRKFVEHSTDPAVWNLMNQDQWDFVVLQEQSQMPSFAQTQVQAQVYPYAKTLDSLIKESNKCARTLFYNTWGRKNGDASNCAFFPPVCTYEGMDSMLYLSYTTMAEANEASLSPVARVWRYLRANHPTIELYSGDESHPTMAGSFAAAATFYAMLFEKDPSLLNYSAGVTTNEAQAIYNAAKLVVFDSIDYWTRFDKNYIDPDFDFQVGNASVFFENLFKRPGFSYKWNFGDGSQESSDENPTHTYNAAGSYKVCLTIYNDCYSETVCKDVPFTDTTNSINKINKQQINIYPNPVQSTLYVDNGYNNATFAIYDVLGKRIKHGKVQNNAIPVHEIKVGIYILLLNNEQGVYQQKFAKE